ncbi:MAG: 16S rRNA (cytidine(1402)-2'-O)-methyltransferase [Thermoanaerobacteraceae bacterium]|nr:16S rRNA (cytidine(1402)-2'-O)-methyltransferase [Thermoanaerobacteraceae bacterium]
MYSSGVLYLCPTPIGNLEDITLRVLRILKEVDLIAAEDTRQTLKLLNHFDIRKPLISYHEHNKASCGAKLIDELKTGKNIALVSDAGTPGISDPGEDIVKLCIKNDIKVIPLPGASALITALIASGLDTREFVFEGFLPLKKKDRYEKLRRISEEKRTVIIYEAPHRLIDTLFDLKNYVKDRNIVIARELTKIHEEFIRGHIDDVIKKVENGVKGEIIILIEGYKEVIKMSPEELLSKYIEEGIDKKTAIKLTAQKLNIPKREVYKLTI